MTYWYISGLDWTYASTWQWWACRYCI